MKKIILVLILFVISGCATIPKDLKAVKGFDINRFTGEWYELARYDHSFEKGLTHVTATYTLRDDGGIDVLNKGFNKTEKIWKEAKGKAYFVSTPDIGRLKVSFFGPFYGGYNIIHLDKENYSYALVCGNKRSYFWILSRKERLGMQKIDELLSIARELGFDTDKLIVVDHNKLFMYVN